MRARTPRGGRLAGVVGTGEAVVAFRGIVAVEQAVLATVAGDQVAVVALLARFDHAVAALRRRFLAPPSSPPRPPTRRRSPRAVAVAVRIRRTIVVAAAGERRGQQRHDSPAPRPTPSTFLPFPRTRRAYRAMTHRASRAAIPK